MFRRTGAILIVALLGLLAAMGVTSAMEPLGTHLEASVTVAAQEDQHLALRRAAVWLVRTHQNDDGGYASFSPGANQLPSTVAGTVDAMLALAAAGYSVSQPFPGRSTTPLVYLEVHPSDVLAFAAADGAQAGKLVLAVTAAGANPRDIGGVNAVQALAGHAQPDGTYGVSDVFKQATAVLGLVAADETIPNKAWQWIADQQAANGSWDDGFGTLDNPDATAMAVMALIAAGRPTTDPAVLAARAFLADAQLSDATWEYGPGLGGNANSTALVIQALAALGEAWYEPGGPWSKGGNGPLSALLAFQGDSGAFQVDFGQGPADDFFSTVQALPAVAGRPLPLPARYKAVQRGLVCLEALQDEASGGWEQFAGFGVNAAGTARAIAAIAAAGEDPQDDRWTPGGVNAIESLELATPEYLGGGRGGRVGIVLQGVVAAGPPYAPESFAGLDLPLLASSYLSPTGEYDSTAFGISAHVEAMLGLIAAGEGVDPSAVAFLSGAQTLGDWGDPDQNGIAINVLGRLGQRLPEGALGVLRQTQLASGGWGTGADVNPSSTSEVVQGLVQAGQNPFGPAWSTVVAGQVTSGADVILSLQGANGCWPSPFGAGDDPYSTTDAIMMLSVDPVWDLTFAHLPVVTGGTR